MSNTVIVHIANEDPIVAELEVLPSPTDTSITVVNPRRRDGKPVPYVTPGANSIIFPLHRITFVEVMTGQTAREDVVEFFRES